MDSTGLESDLVKLVEGVSDAKVSEIIIIRAGTNVSMYTQYMAGL